LAELALLGTGPNALDGGASFIPVDIVPGGDEPGDFSPRGE